ncbi:MAG TPA: N-acetyltransferase [Ruminococcus sp.]|nr:N-acetyltransferase [Ruminococcus sp.]
MEIRENKFDADAFMLLWNAVWDGCPSREQVTAALAHSIYRAAVYDGDRIVGMARMIGDFGLCYYIKDVIVHPDYQGRGVGRMLIETMLTFIRTHGVPGTDIAVELCAMPDKMPFYAKFGFAANEAQRMRLMCRAEGMT